MDIKILEIRDRATFFLILCVDMNPGFGEEAPYRRKALRTYGYPCDHRPNILITHLRGDGQANNDPYSWGDRTYSNAHNYITDHWEELNEGDVVDVEFILGEAPAKKISELVE